jgi:hypothetical protein
MSLSAPPTAGLRSPLLKDKLLDRPCTNSGVSITPVMLMRSNTNYDYIDNPLGAAAAAKNETANCLWCGYSKSGCMCHVTQQAGLGGLGALAATRPVSGALDLIKSRIGGYLPATLGRTGLLSSSLSTFGRSITNTSKSFSNSVSGSSLGSFSRLATSHNSMANPLAASSIPTHPMIAS